VGRTGQEGSPRSGEVSQVDCGGPEDNKAVDVSNPAPPAVPVRTLLLLMLEVIPSLFLLRAGVGRKARWWAMASIFVRAGRKGFPFLDGGAMLAMVVVVTLKVCDVVL